jgi:gamma-glutamyltranspeptidase/glutathione hydrolase
MTFTTRPELRGDFGMVASTHWLASAAGMSMLESGGNAADAAVTIGFVLNVVEPHLNGPGGEVPILVWSPDDDDVSVVAGQGPVPAAATIEGYRDLGLDLVPGSGLLAATVPGAFGAWLTLLQRWGTRPLREVLEPAIALAERGWPVIPAVSQTIGRVAALFRDEWGHSAATWLPEGRPPAPGSRMRNPELAATWRRLLAEAEAVGSDRDAQIDAALVAFYRGFVAEAIDAHVRQPVMDSSGRRHAGLLTADDLAGWRTPIEASVSIDYQGLEVHKTGPWGQGPVFLQQLRLLEAAGIEHMEHLGADYVHTVLESTKLAFADREAWYGDPEAVDVPLATLLSRAYAADRVGLIGPRASLDQRPGSPDGRAPRMPTTSFETGAASAPGVGEPTVAWSGNPTRDGAATDGPVAANGAVRGDTCHLDVIDRDGMVISATPSGGWLPSSPTIRGLGFALGSRAQMTWLEPGLASSLRPGTRPRTTLTPTMILRDGRPLLAFGTPGGDQQDQWSLQFLLSHLHGGLEPQAAIDAPTFHSIHFAESFWPRGASPAGAVVESRLPESVLLELERRGHRLTRSDDFSLGRIGMVGRDPATGFLTAAADPRGGQAYAVGR